jgi:hypothetical protein
MPPPEPPHEHTFPGTLLKARAVIINVAAALHLSDDRAATMAAGDQSREGETQRFGPHVTRTAAISTSWTFSHVSWVTKGSCVP